MNACPKCGTKNQPSSDSCGTCGAFLGEPVLQTKKNTVLGGRKRPLWAILAGFALVLAVGFVYWFTQSDTLAAPKIPPQPKVSAGVDYTGQTIQMADVQVKTAAGKIAIPMEAVLEKKIVRFEVETPKGKIPLTAYLTPSGRVVTAVSMCEPCRSSRFHIKGTSLICNACATEWTLETLKGIRGGCLAYPPDAMPNKVENGQILIEEKAVLDWKPRV
jgi:hypothetical protein